MNINAKGGRWLLGQLKLYFLPSHFLVIAPTSVANKFLNLSELFLKTPCGIPITTCGVLVQLLGLSGLSGPFMVLWAFSGFLGPFLVLLGFGSPYSSSKGYCSFVSSSGCLKVSRGPDCGVYNRKDLV